MSTRENIVSVAAGLFHQHGFAKVSLADVAAAAGVQKGNLSYHFKSKDALLLAVAAYWRAIYLAPITERQEWTGAHEAVEAFLSAVEHCADMLARHGCPVGGLAIDALRCQPAARDEALANLLALQRWLRLHLERRMGPALAESTAEQMLVSMQGAALMAQVSADPGVVVRQVTYLRQWLATIPEWADQSRPGRPPA